LNPHLKDFSLFWLFGSVELSQFVDLEMRRNDVPSISFDVDFQVLYFALSCDEGSENVSCFEDCSNTFCFIFICPFDDFQSDLSIFFS
jgi:hypothetical protein